MEKEHTIQIIILAGGKGTRMESVLPKALAPLHGKPMISHLMQSVKEISNEKPVVIIGHQGELIEKELGDNAVYAIQEEQLGTAHALLQAEKFCNEKDTIIVLSADQPKVKSSTIINCLNKHLENNSKITFATTTVPDFLDWKQYFYTHGRVLRVDGRVVGVREFKDASEQEKENKEVNSGCVYIFNSKWLWENVKKIDNKNSKGEYYLTDLFEIAKNSGVEIETYEIDNMEALGANSKIELEMLEKFA